MEPESVLSCSQGPSTQLCPNIISFQLCLVLQVTRLTAMYFFYRFKTENSGSSLKLNAFKRQWPSGKWLCSIANVWLAWGQTRMYSWRNWRKNVRRCIRWVSCRVSITLIFIVLLPALAGVDCPLSSVVLHWNIMSHVKAWEQDSYHNIFDVSRAGSM